MTFGGLEYNDNRTIWQIMAFVIQKINRFSIELKYFVVVYYFVSKQSC